MRTGPRGGCCGASASSGLCAMDRRLPGVLRPSGSEGHGCRLPVAVALVLDVDLVAGLVLADGGAQVVRRGDAVAAEGRDDVARPEPAVVRRRAGAHRIDEGALRRLDPASLPDAVGP